MCSRSTLSQTNSPKLNLHLYKTDKSHTSESEQVNGSDFAKKKKKIFNQSFC